jgi:hypothetical protein
VARSRTAFLTLLLGLVALAVATQYTLLILSGAVGVSRSAMAQAQHAWHTAASKAAHVTHGAPHWGWASAQTGAPPLPLAAAARAKETWRALPSWLGGARAHASWWSYSPARREGVLSRVMAWRRPACAPPVAGARACAHCFASSHVLTQRRRHACVWRAGGNWARVALSRTRYNACEAVRWTRTHLLPWPLAART